MVAFFSMDSHTTTSLTCAFNVGVVRDKLLCTCSRSKIFTDKAPFHALNCSSSQWYYKHRHDGLRDILIQFLKDYSSDDPNLYKIFTEPKVIGLVNNQEEQEADVAEIEKDGRNHVEC
jgi:hypothetical protein